MASLRAACEDRGAGALAHLITAAPGTADGAAGWAAGGDGAVERAGAGFVGRLQALARGTKALAQSRLSAYGSTASGFAGRSSDMDVCLQVETRVPLHLPGGKRPSGKARQRMRQEAARLCNALRVALKSDS